VITQPIRVVVAWDGHVWQDVNAIVQIEDRAELLADAGGYRPRRLSLEVDLGAAVDLVAEGAHHSTAKVSVWIGPTIVFAGAVADMVPGRAGELTQIECVGAQFGTAEVPSGAEVQIRKIDVEATNAKREAWRAKAIAEATPAGLWGPAEPPEIVFVNDYTSEERWERINEKFRDGLTRPRNPFVPWVPRFDYIYEGSFVQLAEKSEGLVYPWVFGQPGCETNKPSTRAYVVDVNAQLLLVAGHHGVEGTATVYGPKKNATEDWATDTVNVYNDFDANGRPVMLIDVTGTSNVQNNWSTHPEAAEKDWYLRWDGTASGLSGDAVDVLQLLLGKGAGAVDYASIEALRGHLRGYQFDGVLETRVEVATLLDQSILPLLPVALVPSLYGLALAPVRLDATASDARLKLVEGRDFDAMSRPAWTSGGEIANGITVRYAPNRKSGRSPRFVVATSETHAEAARSVQLHGPAPLEIETAWVHRRAVADRVARYMMLKKAVDRREVVCAFAAARFGLGASDELAIGDVVVITITDEAITEKVALVSGITRDGGPVDVVRLLIL